MNVTSNGYYSSSYLDKRRRKPELNGVNKQTFYTPMVPVAREDEPRGTSDNRFSFGAPFSFLFGKDEAKEDDFVLPSSVTPYIVADQQRTEPISWGTRIPSNGQVNPEDDPDFLEQGITPADLTILKKRNFGRSMFKRNDKMNPSGDAPSATFSGYYINQKKRQEKSPFKFKNYTHGSFKEVFNDDEEISAKYNPMELVFSEERDGKFKNMIKSVHSKIAKDDYKNYDYYLNTSPKRHVSEDELTLANEHNENKVGKKDIFKKALLRKSKSRSVPLSDKELVTSEPEVIEPEVMEPEVIEPDDPKPKYSNQDFYPLWNYVLSWLVYDSNQIPLDQKSEVNASSFLQASNNRATNESIGSKSVGKNLKKLKSNYNQALAKWNQPVSMRSRGERANHCLQLEDSKTQELVVELDESISEDEFDEELYYNPLTKQLDRAPSHPRNIHYPPHSDGIFSNFNKLIKNIKVMRIIFTPIDIIGQVFPSLQSIVIFLELFIFLWILYELSLLIDALCMMVKAFCAPMIAMGRFMNRIM